jgi:hypothetical protein
MPLKTIRNRIEPDKSFVYSKVHMIDRGGRPEIEPYDRARKIALDHTLGALPEPKLTH